MSDNAVTAARDDVVQRESSSAREGKGNSATNKRQGELEARWRKETGFGVHEHDGAKHRDREPEAGQSREQTNYQCETAKKLDECDERTRDARQRNPHLGEGASDAGESECEQLLRAMRHEHDSGDEAQQEKGEIGVTGDRDGASGFHGDWSGQE